MTKYFQLIDHTYLKPEATSKEIDKLVAEALKYKFKTVCVNSYWVEYVAAKLKGSSVGITCVVGFPLGASLPQVKAYEASEAIALGASEIDMVMNIGAFKEQHYDTVVNNIMTVKKTCGSKILKVIIETALLTDQEIALATELVVKSGADFVKTSTGFSSRGAQLKDIQIMAAATKGQIAIKAAGGISSLADLEQMYQAGATRFGTSKSVHIFENTQADKNAY
ncbi:deoxyribose-phosphate aldolase [Mycoplasmopsis columbinasalis]|uniref:Deoxyribose-phosphate aldolase n=1 Tax=Mycoplasmopsis columbinasalis TaxID=114880 RepID=A0A449B9F0_9BACT|nr:deoxyribose-phosphate aldolase [Mycoplasmopsis columbinasalis]VEU77809.1 deoxyribose-phosphate aldolase [Mycoplasmopsis columbinasalis]